LTIIIIDKG